MKIIIDAMGGDNAPLEIVKGALQAQKRFGAAIVFTGGHPGRGGPVRRGNAAAGCDHPPHHGDGGDV